MNQGTNNHVNNRFASSPQGSVGWYDHDGRTPIFVFPPQYPTYGSHQNRGPPPSPMATGTYSNAYPLSHDQYHHHLCMSQIPSPYNKEFVPSRRVGMHGGSPSHASRPTTTRPGYASHSPYQDERGYGTQFGNKSTFSGMKKASPQPICRYFYNGQECKFGNKCHFRHSYQVATSYPTPVRSKTMHQTSPSTGQVLPKFRDHVGTAPFARKLTFPSITTEKIDGSVGRTTKWKTLSTSKTIIVQPKHPLRSPSSTTTVINRCQPPAFTVFNIADARHHLTPAHTVITTKVVIFEREET